MRIPWEEEEDDDDEETPPLPNFARILALASSWSLFCLATYSASVSPTKASTPFGSPRPLLDEDALEEEDVLEEEDILDEADSLEKELFE